MRFRRRIWNFYGGFVWHLSSRRRVASFPRWLRSRASLERELPESPWKPPTNEDVTRFQLKREATLMRESR